MTDASEIVINTTTESSIEKIDSGRDVELRPTQPEPLDTGGFPHIRKKKDGTLKLKGTIDNVEHLLNGYEIVARYNVISKKPEISIPGLSASFDNYLNTAIETIVSLASLNDLPITQVPKYVGVIADRNPVNPVANWIASKPWDGKNRQLDICETLVPRDEFPLMTAHQLVWKWLLSATAAAVLPSGFHGRGILTLQGPQGIGKTSWVRRLVSDPMLRSQVVLTGHHLEVSLKDSITTAICHWIVELGEVDSSLKKEFTRTKAFATQDKDKLRRPYARTDSEYQRRTVFSATVNEENFLLDKTGNSRFWVIPVTSIDYDHQIDMQQVFAQLKVQLDNGSNWWLKPEEEAQLTELNKDYRAVSVLEEKLLTIFDNELSEEEWSRMSATEVLETLGYSRPPNHLCRECGGILREHFGLPKKSNGIMKWRVPIKTASFTRVS
jgi:putative DNA primase/helicase